MEQRNWWPRGWRGLALLVVGGVMAANLISPAIAHIGTPNHLWKQHIKPKADDRYVLQVAQQGQTLSGVLSVRYIPHTDNPFVLASGSFPVTLPAGTETPELVYVEGTSSATCPGFGQAPSGVLCIYGFNRDNIASVGFSGGTDGFGNAFTRWGFSLDISVTTPESPGWLIANWAYTVGTPPPLRVEPSETRRGSHQG